MLRTEIEMQASTMENAKPGHRVEFYGLKGAAHLNETTGRLVKFLTEEQRWVVRCDNDGKEVNAKLENLQHLGEPTHQALANSSTSARPSCFAPGASNSRGNVNSLHGATLDSFYKRRKGGVVISCRKSYMLAVEFDGPFDNGGVYGEMVYVDKNPQARAVVQQRGCASAKELGKNFLTGETVEYIETTDESSFFNLLNRYRRGSSTQGHIDLHSGLRLYNVKIAK